MPDRSSFLRRWLSAAIFSLIAAAGLQTSPQLIAGDWPQILGPHRNGEADNEKLADTWPADGPKTLWQRPVGRGYAGLAVVGQTGILFHRVENEERVESIDAATGKEGWHFAVPDFVRLGHLPRRRAAVRPRDSRRQSDRLRCAGNAGLPPPVRRAEGMVARHARRVPRVGGLFRSGELADRRGGQSDRQCRRFENELRRRRLCARYGQGAVEGRPRRRQLFFADRRHGWQDAAPDRRDAVDDLFARSRKRQDPFSNSLWRTRADRQRSQPDGDRRPSVPDGQLRRRRPVWPHP